MNIKINSGYKNDYTNNERAVYYVKRFLKVFIPTVLAVAPTLGLTEQGFILAVLVPCLTTLEKWLRDYQILNY